MSYTNVYFYLLVIMILVCYILQEKYLLDTVYVRCTCSRGTVTEHRGTLYWDIDHQNSTVTSLTGIGEMNQVFDSLRPK